MKQLIELNATSERVTVSARELHNFLGASERFGNWFYRMSQYGLIEGTDFTSVKNFTVVNNGAKRELDDYQLTIDAAKQISMLQRNERGMHVNTSLKLRTLGTAQRKLWHEHYKYHKRQLKRCV